MHKNKSARVQAGKNGGVEVVVCLTPGIIATADEFAVRLQVTREEVLATYFATCLENTPDGIREFIPEGWVFPTKERADAFIEREQLNPRQYIAQEYESGGWGLTDTAEYVVEFPRQHAVAV